VGLVDFGGDVGQTVGGVGAGDSSIDGGEEGESDTVVTD
jgi:hypothetical protein